MAEKKGIPAWVWIGCGCLLFPALVVLVLAVAGFSVFKYGQAAIDKMADPEKRAAAARETLGAASLPEGWHVRTFFAFPFGFSLLALGDGTPPAPPAGETFEEKARSLENINLGNLGDNRRMFLFLELDQKNEDTLEEILNGKNRGSGMNLDLGVKFESERELSRGDLQVAGHRVAFAAKAGQLETRGGDHDIVYSELSFDCPDKKRRLGILFELAPESAAPAPEAAPAPGADSGGGGAGTVADPRYLQTYLDHFDVCR